MAIDLIQIKSFPSTKNLSPAQLVPIIKLCNLLRVPAPKWIFGINILDLDFTIDFDSLKSYHGSDPKKAAKSIKDMLSSVKYVQDINVDLEKNRVFLRLELEEGLKNG